MVFTTAIRGGACVCFLLCLLLVPLFVVGGACLVVCRLFVLDVVSVIVVVVVVVVVIVVVAVAVVVVVGGGGGGGGAWLSLFCFVGCVCFSVAAFL